VAAAFEVVFNAFTAGRQFRADFAGLTEPLAGHGEDDSGGGGPGHCTRWVISRDTGKGGWQN